ncbi:hypothetical protein Mal64_31400 [Pseudobythopirellula maris]|uniref:Uncharacterized protein n=1 Tax=Pseudobythopirellula maris TaxID=2527991 RepID=A0A5C5ZKD8_9BACT|nr:hypothetical protein [Pseudobythopirellula maris]TWT87598.1 hypothetical protein Mal64_31400 [Pseudobythopirellula maris]
MARCDEGYLCDVCGEDVGAMTDSAMYLRYVTGGLDPEVLHTYPERHLRCEPELAQYIVHEKFKPVACEGPFDKRALDAEYVAQREGLMTRGWLRLRELAGGELPLRDYPLPEVAEAMRSRYGDG